MPSLLTSELAAVSTGFEFYLFYQDGTNILQAHSADNNSWTTDSTAIAEDGLYSGSALTAYFVASDANFDRGPTLHLLYKNQQNYLVEKVKKLTGGSATWQDVALDDSIKTGPDPNSRLTGAAYNDISGWNPEGSQWVYFSQGPVITEIRRTGVPPWHSETVLPDRPGESLPGTSLAVAIQTGQIDLFFQGYDQSIYLYQNQNGWSGRNAYVDKGIVQINTPLAAAIGPLGSTHLFFANSNNKIADFVEGELQEVDTFYPGSKLGAVAHRNGITLFYRSVNPVGEVGTYHFDGSTWTKGTQVVPA